MLTPIPEIFCLLITGVCGITEIATNDIELDENIVDLVEERGIN